jgi:hypothetical protein
LGNRTFDSTAYLLLFYGKQVDFRSADSVPGHVGRDNPYVSLPTNYRRGGKRARTLYLPVFAAAPPVRPNIRRNTSRVAGSLSTSLNEQTWSRSPPPARIASNSPARRSGDL